MSLMIPQFPQNDLIPFGDADLNVPLYPTFLQNPFPLTDPDLDDPVRKNDIFPKNDPDLDVPEYPRVPMNDVFLFADPDLGEPA